MPGEHHGYKSSHYNYRSSDNGHLKEVFLDDLAVHASLKLESLTVVGFFIEQHLRELEGRVVVSQLGVSNSGQEATVGCLVIELKKLFHQHDSLWWERRKTNGGLASGIYSLCFLPFRSCLFGYLRRSAHGVIKKFWQIDSGKTGMTRTGKSALSVCWKWRFSGRLLFTFEMTWRSVQNGYLKCCSRLKLQVTMVMLRCLTGFNPDVGRGKQWRCEFF